MRKMFNKTLLILALIYNSIGFAQTDALLWKISGNGLTKPSFIFGTIHAYCDGDKFIKQELLDALNSTETVAMELNLNDFKTFSYLMKASMKKSQSTISSKLSKSEYQIIDSVCLSLLNDSLTVFNDLTPMTLLGKLYLSAEILGCRSIPIDMIIAELAKREGKESIGLETVGFQDSILNTIPDSLQIKWLLELCKNVGKAKSDLSALLEAYDSQSSDKLYNLIFKTSPEMVYMEDILLNQRNINWVHFLKDSMHDKSFFVAVGAGHLGGKNGMIELLKEAGYILTPIKINY